MNEERVAKASGIIDASAADVWHALTTPESVKKFMFGTTVVSSWNVGSPITFEGEWQGRPYKDKGVIKRFEPQRVLQYTHFSGMSGKPDVPENYHTVTVQLSPRGNQTLFELSQDNNATEEERQHSESNWRMMLDSLKKLLEAPKSGAKAGAMKPVKKAAKKTSKKASKKAKKGGKKGGAKKSARVKRRR